VAWGKNICLTVYVSPVKVICPKIYIAESIGGQWKCVKYVNFLQLPIEGVLSKLTLALTK
jgi:hypothetical protein